MPPSPTDMNATLIPLHMLDFFLKGSLIVLASWSFSRLAARRSARMSRGAWVVAFAILGLILPSQLLDSRPHWTWWNWAAAGAEPLKSTPAPESAPEALPTEKVGATPPVPAPVSLPPSSPTHWPLGHWLTMLWLLGAATVVGIRLASEVELSRLRRHSPRVTDPRVGALLHSLSTELGVRRPVDIRESPGIQPPMVCGWLWPIILLPENSAESGSRLSHILRHELTHIRYGDIPGRWITTLACAVHWWNPLVWFGARCYRQAQEEACDEAVLVQGTDPVSYSEDLLALAGSFRQSIPSGAIAMARPSNLRRRIELILDISRPRRPMTLWGHLTLMTFGLVMVLPCLMVGVQSHAAEAPPSAAQGKRSISIHVMFFECPAYHTEKFRMRARLVDKTTEFLSPKEHSEVLRDLLQGEIATVTSYPKCVTADGCEVKIRSVVNVPQTVSHGTASRVAGTELEITPRIEQNGTSIAATIRCNSSTVGWNSGQVALDCTGLLPGETVASLMVNGDRPLISLSGKLLAVMITFDLQ